MDDAYQDQLANKLIKIYGVVENKDIAMDRSHDKIEAYDQYFCMCFFVQQIFLYKFQHLHIIAPLLCCFFHYNCRDCEKARNYKKIVIPAEKILLPVPI